MRETLRKRRQELNLTQTELGRLLGMTKTSVCDLEKGRTEGSVRTWDKLEAVLGMPQKELRRLNPEPPKRLLPPAMESRCPGRGWERVEKALGYLRRELRRLKKEKEAASRQDGTTDGYPWRNDAGEG
jgi:transcriptional regulator with XRE-family HTH domain